MKKSALLLSALLLITPTSAAFANEEDHSEDISTQEISLDEIELVEPVETDNGMVEPQVLVSTKASFTSAWIAGTALVSKRGHTFTAELMSRSLNGPYTTAVYSNSSRASNLIKANTSFKNILNGHKSRMGINPTGITNKTFSSSDAFTSGELYTSLHNYSYNINIAYNATSKKWSYNGTVTDRFDFVWEKFNKTYSGFDTTLGNNTGAIGLSAGYIKPFNIQIFVQGEL